MLPPIVASRPMHLADAFDVMLLNQTTVSNDNFSDTWGAADTEDALALSGVDGRRLNDCIVSASASVWGIPGDVPNPAQGVFLSTPPALPQFTRGCSSDRRREDSHTAHTRGNQEGNHSYFYSPANPFRQCYAQVQVVESKMGKHWRLSSQCNLSRQPFSIPEINSPLLYNWTKHIINVVCISFASVPYQSAWRAWRICHVRPWAHAKAACHGQGAHSRAARVIFRWTNTCSSCWILPAYTWQSTTRLTSKAHRTYGHVSDIIPLDPIITTDCGFVYFQLHS